MPAELCSTGEQKSLLVSIILAQTKCQILNQGFAPVLLLDEVCAHLDDGKREALLEKSASWTYRLSSLPPTPNCSPHSATMPNFGK